MDNFSITADDLLSIAEDSYSTVSLKEAATKGAKVGDLLAVFIANELKETLDPEQPIADQLHQAMECLEVAVQDLQAVQHSFDEVLIQIKRVQKTPKKGLPLLMGKFTHPIAQNYLDSRLKKGAS